MVTKQIFSTRFVGMNICHGFTTIHAGDMSDPAATWDRLDGLDPASFVDIRQVHGSDVLKVDQPAENLGERHSRCFDASMSDRPDVVLGVRTADCVPILLCSKRKNAVAAVHAGWRGTFDAIAGKTVDQLQQAYDCVPQEIVAVLGPSIRRCCYEVSKELFFHFYQRHGEASGFELLGKTYLDLIEINRKILLEQGLCASNIEVIEHCTCCESDLFFSYRREKESAGRQLAYITLGS